MEILGIQWSEFEPVVKYLIHDYPICREVNDIISVSHEQVRDILYASPSVKYLWGNIWKSRSRLGPVYRLMFCQMYLV